MKKLNNLFDFLLMLSPIIFFIEGGIEKYLIVFYFIYLPSLILTYKKKKLIKG
jgi:Ca2+/Na+ antiporter